MPSTPWPTGCTTCTPTSALDTWACVKTWSLWMAATCWISFSRQALLEFLERTYGSMRMATLLEGDFTVHIQHISSDEATFKPSNRMLLADSTGGTLVVPIFLSQFTLSCPILGTRSWTSSTWRLGSTTTSTLAPGTRVCSVWMKRWFRWTAVTWFALSAASPAPKERSRSGTTKFLATYLIGCWIFNSAGSNLTSCHKKIHLLWQFEHLCFTGSLLTAEQRSDLMNRKWHFILIRLSGREKWAAAGSVLPVKKMSTSRMSSRARPVSWAGGPTKNWKVSNGT